MWISSKTDNFILLVRKRKAAPKIFFEAASIAIPQVEFFATGKFLLLGVYADRLHHAEILMRENVAVIDEVADVHAAEVHQQLDLRDRAIGIFLVVPEGDFDHVQELPVDGRGLGSSVDFEVVLGEDFEMDLVHVEFMIFWAMF